MMPTNTPGRPRPVLPEKPTNTPLWLALGGLGVLALVVVIALRPKGPKWNLVDTLEVSWRVTPSWSKTSPETAAEPVVSPPARLAIYLDVSAPMGGFLPPRPGVESPLAVLLPQLGAHAARVPGMANLDLEWRAFPNEPEPLPAAPQPLSRELFRGGESPLGGKVRELLERLDNGELGAAVLVTDLVATGELTGAMGVATALTTAAQGPAAQRGQLHLGLFGVKSPYWGVVTPSCRGAEGLGCWYSEYRQSFFPLDTLGQKPLYFLVLGLRREVVEAVGEGLGNLSKERGWVAQWELLTACSSSGREVTTKCTFTTPDGGVQRTLLATPERTFKCQDDHLVKLECALGPISEDLPFATLSAESAWGAASARMNGTAFEAVIDCGALREAPPGGDLDFSIRGPAKAVEAEWGEWSTETDDRAKDLERTLHLSHFLERVRLVPETYEMETETSILRR